MTYSLVAVLCLIAGALGVAVVAGVLVKRRSGHLRETSGNSPGDSPGNRPAQAPSDERWLDTR